MQADKYIQGESTESFTMIIFETTVEVHYSGIQQSGMPDSPASLRKIVKILVFSKSVSLKQIKTLESYSELQNH